MEQAAFPVAILALLVALLRPYLPFLPAGSPSGLPLEAAPSVSASEHADASRTPSEGREQASLGAPVVAPAATGPDAPPGASNDLSGAEAALRIKDIQSAEARFRAVIEQDETVAAAHSGLAYSLLAQRKMSAARREAFRALRLNLRDARANLVLGTIAQNRGYVEDACRRYRRYLELGGGPRATEIRNIIAEQCGP